MLIHIPSLYSKAVEIESTDHFFGFPSLKFEPIAHQPKTARMLPLRRTILLELIHKYFGGEREHVRRIVRKSVIP